MATIVPLSTRKPGTYIGIDTTNARSGSTVVAKKVLLIGYMGSGTADADKPYQITRSNQGEALFGAGSELDKMVKSAARANRFVDLWAAGIEADSAGTQASRTLTFTGLATEAGSITIFIHGEPVSVSIPDETTAVQAAALAKTAIDNKGADLLVTAAVGANPNEHVLTISYRHKSTTGNSVALRVEQTDATGITATLAGAALTGGVGDMDLDDLLEAIAPEKFDRIVCSDNAAAIITDLRDHVDANADAIEQRGQQAIVGWIGSFADAITRVASVNAARVQIAAYPTCEAAPLQIAAAMGAVRAYEEGLDPNKPLNTVALDGIPAALSKSTRAEQESALAAGVTPIETGAGDKARIVRSITTYLVDDSDLPDDALLDTGTIGTLDDLRDDIRATLSRRFSRSKATVATAQSVRSTILERLAAREEDEWVENVEANKDDVVVAKNKEVAGRFDCRIPASIVQGLHVLAGVIDLRIDL